MGHIYFYTGFSYRNVDFINLMMYDFHGSWDTVVNVHSALYSDNDLSVVKYRFSLIIVRCLVETVFWRENSSPWQIIMETKVHKNQ